MTDELVLNFLPPSASPSSAPTRSTGSGGRKGGRWTDRAKERKRSQIEARKASRGIGTGTAGGRGQPRQGVKPSREDEGADDAASAKRERTAGGGAPPAQGGKRRLDMAVGPSGKKQYISSLFTAEGLPSTALDSSTSSSAPIVPSKPSNAPLTSVPSIREEEEDAGEADEGPDPAPELSKLGLMRELVAGLAGKLGISGPTACQAGAIPRLVPPSSSRSKGKGKGRASGADFAHDAILRAQTGSGKTLTFLLPMLQDLLTLPPSSLPTPPSSGAKTNSPDRSIGTLALILAPTRELASQIHTVLSTLLSSLPSSSPNPNKPFTISPRALTAGLLVGGANRTHEKRRLRKGCPIVVATPGRLLDHLKTTEAFRLAGEAPKPKEGAPKGRLGNPNTVALGTRSGGGEGKVGLRWLIVDECDRLMDLGFEEQMKGILEDLARRSPPSSTNGAMRRRTILCSATASEGVDRLAGMAISDADEGGKGMVVVGAREDVRVTEPERRDLTHGAGAKRGGEVVEDGDEDRAEDDEDSGQDEDAKAESAALALPSGFTPPSQLQHNYIVVPPKLRFVTLVALLRKLLVKASSANGGRGMKVLVFMSCTDAVDFWWKALGKMKMGTSSNDDADEEEEEEEDEKAESARLVSLHPLLPATPIYRLHGSLPLQTRLSSLSAFSSPYTIEDGKRKGAQTDAGVLLCTSVAARGLDVKNVGCVVQVDAPTEGGVTEYVHRVGRTARAGAQGTAYSFILPSESAYTSFLEDGINASSASTTKGKKVRMREVGVEQVLRDGFGGEGREYETRATDVQMGFERWVNASEETSSLARKAFQAHIRAYATHPSSEKHIFNTKALHLGHLAKSFGMREAPGAHTGSSSKKGGSNKRARVSAGGTRARDDEGGFEVGPRKRKAMDAEQRMKKLMRGPQALGASEFHIAGNDMLEGVVKRK